MSLREMGFSSCMEMMRERRFHGCELKAGKRC